MRILFAGLTLPLLAILSPLTSPLFALQNGAPEGPADPISLFDGATLDGWRGDPSFWSVENGEIVGRSTAENPCRRTTYLTYTGGEFEDFDLSVDFLIEGEGSNSGVQFRSLRSPGALGDGYQVTGYQADLDARRDWTGGLYEQGGRGVIARRGVRMIQNGGHTAYERLGDLAELSKLGAPGAWHTYRIRAEGSRIRIWVNGTLTCDFDDREPHIEGKAIAFQLHQGPPMEVRYRNVAITPLEIAALPESDLGTAQWIWSTGEGGAAGSKPAGVVRFERRIQAKGTVTGGTLTASCDNGVEFSVNDLVFAGGEDWSAPFQVPITPKFVKSLNLGQPLTLRAECWNSDGPAGLIARLTLEYDDGRVEAVETDRWWQARVAGEPVPATELGPFGCDPWGQPTGRSSGVPDLPLAASKLELRPGFEAEELLRVPRAYGSWACMTTDDSGRIIAGAEAQHGVFRVTLGEQGDGATIEPLGLEIGGVQGLLVHGSDLYLMRNEPRVEDNGLWRARDTDGDDRYDELRHLARLEGWGEHGPHAIRLAPDGQHLEVIAGNATPFPDGAATRARADWQEDQLLASLPDTFGHGNSMHAHGGWLGRCDLDGENWEILSTGMRNSYSFAYDRAGERFAYDADMEWDMGAPWYRAPRVLHLVPGIEYGWRRGSGKILETEPDTLVSVAQTGPASPVGVLHGKDGRYPGAFGEALYLGDWTRGIVYSLDLTPTGDTFTGEPQPFVSGRPFPITDMTWLADGSMAIVTGGRGRRSALYRVSALAPREPSEIDPNELVQRSGPKSGGPVASQLRRVALETNPAVASWAPRVLRERDPIGWLALARAGGAEWQGPLLRSILESEGALGHVALRSIELSLARAGLPAGDLGEALLSRMEAECAADTEMKARSGEHDLDTKRTEILVALDSELAPAYGVPRMIASVHQERAIDFALQLGLARNGWTEGLARAYLDFLHVEGARFYGGRSIQGYLNRIREEALENAGPAIPGGYVPPEVEPVAADEDVYGMEGPLFVEQWTLRALAPLLPKVADATDASLGKRSFRRAGCYACHRVGEEGGGTGPDLTDAGGRFTPRDLLIAILEPSRDISDQYLDTEIWTHDSQVHVGRLVESTEEWTTLRLPPSEPGAADGELIDVAADEIRLTRAHPSSRMPSGTIDCLKTDEIVELLGWLLAEK